MDLILVSLFDLVYTIATLALISAGLALVFGLMRVINLAHGEFIVLGGYATIVALQWGVNIWVAMLVVAPLTVGVFGLIGSGIETLGRALYGALGSRTSGVVHLNGAPYRPTTAAAGKRAGIGFVAADRKKEGIIAELTVRENMVAPFLERFVERGFISRRREMEQARRWIEDLSIRTRGPEQRIRTLSGGNQQKVAVARWLVDGVSLLILEEPTRGVDVGARREIYHQLRHLADRGLAVLVISSDVEEVAGISDRSLVLDRGAIVGRFERGATPEDLMAATVADPAHNAA